MMDMLTQELPTDCKQAAHWWYEFGFSVAPMDAKEKHTRLPWLPWLKRLENDGHGAIESEFRPNDELCAIVDDRFFILDADTPMALASLRGLELSFDVQPNLVVKTKHGEHHYFRKAAGSYACMAGHSTKEHPDRLDVRTARGAEDGRSVIVLPPSTGRSIVINEADDASDLVEVGQEFIDAVFRHNGQEPPRPGDPDQPPPVRGPVKANEVSEILSYINPGCGYSDWLTVLAGVHDKFMGTMDGFEIVDAWSAEADNYGGREEMEYKWRSFDSDRPGKRVTTFASVAKMAELAGANLSEIAKSYDANGNKITAVDLFNTLKLPSFPLHLLPRAIADYAKDQGELIGVDPAVIAMAAIGAAAACIDDRLEIQPKRYDTGWREQARLWVGIIGDPSAKKSPGISKAMGPLFKIDQQWREESAREHAKWLEACDNTPKGEQEPPAPISKRLILNDATVEKMGDILSKCHPRGILSYQDELSGWLASHDAYKQGAGKDKADWLQAYNGGPKAIDRVSRGSIFVENWSACVIGGIQPSVVQAYAHNTNHDGMLQRFVLVQAGEARLGADRPPDIEAKERYYSLMRQLSETLAAGDCVVTLSEDAHKVREALDEKLHRITRSHPNKYLVAALGKWSGLFARLLLSFHCIECGTAYEHPTAKEVQGDTAQRVAELMWKTLFPHAVAFYNGLDTVEDTARELAGLLLARGWARFTVKRDLNRHWRASRKLKPWELEETLDRLEAFGWIFPEPGHLNEKGKPAAYFVNPSIHERFKDRAEEERARRKEVAAAMAELKAVS